MEYQGIIMYRTQYEDYWVTKCGKVISTKKDISNEVCVGRAALKITIRGEFFGWTQVTLSKGKLILETFGYKQPSEEYQVRRIDLNKGYSLDNIKWSTVSEIQSRLTKRRNRSVYDLPVGVKLAGSKFEVNMTTFGTLNYLGTFNTIEEAAECYRDIHKEWHGVEAAS